MVLDDSCRIHFRGQDVLSACPLRKPLARFQEAGRLFQTSFKADITRRLAFTETFNATLTGPESGLYSHHAVSTLEFEIKRHLDLNVSFVWDYLQNPQIESSGVVPQHSDFRLNVGVGVKF